MNEKCSSSLEEEDEEGGNKEVYKTEYSKFSEIW